MVYAGTLPRQSGVILARCELWVQGSGFRVQGSGSRVLGSGFRVQGSGPDQGLRIRIQSRYTNDEPQLLNPGTTLKRPRAKGATSGSCMTCTQYSRVGLT